MARIKVGIGSIKGLTFHNEDEGTHPLFVEGAPEYGILRGIGDGWFTVDATIWDLIAGLVGGYEYVFEDLDEKQLYTSVFGGGVLLVKVKTME